MCRSFEAFSLAKGCHRPDGAHGALRSACNSAQTQQCSHFSSAPDPVTLAAPCTTQTVLSCTYYAPPSPASPHRRVNLGPISTWHQSTTRIWVSDGSVEGDYGRRHTMGIGVAVCHSRCMLKIAVIPPHLTSPRLISAPFPPCGVLRLWRIDFMDSWKAHLGTA